MYITCLVVIVFNVQLHLEVNKLGLGQGRRTFGTSAQMVRGKTFLARGIHLSQFF